MILDIKRQISQSRSGHKVNSSGVVGHGIYLIEISRFQKLRNQLGESLEHHCFTRRERCNSFSGERRLHFLAGCLAGKNAVVRALGQNNTPENSWRSIDIRKLPSGQPSVVLSGEVQNLADRLGIKTWMLSISNTPSYIVASAIAFGSQPCTVSEF